ncbi:dihydrofolate reductase, partial [Lactobacillus sp. XV13L]|nr:dihydrofolate reductase [Lactobacillus sp. XV13L]
MSKVKVLVTGTVPEAGLTELKKNFTVTYNPAGTSRTLVLNHLAEYEGVILAGMKGDRELIDAGPNLKVISASGVGYDHIDVDYAKQKGIVVANCPQSVLLPTAELTFTLLLATVRRLHFYDKMIRAGKWPNVSNPEYMGTGLQGKTLGIYGMGRIGRQVAKYAQVFGMKVIYKNTHRLDPELEE